VLGYARNAEDAERHREGANAAGAASAGMLPASLGTWHDPLRQCWCLPAGRETEDRKLWLVFLWHRHCPVLDLCRDGSRTDTSSTDPILQRSTSTHRAHLLPWAQNTSFLICTSQNTGRNKNQQLHARYILVPALQAGKEEERILRKVFKAI